MDSSCLAVFHDVWTLLKAFRKNPPHGRLAYCIPRCGSQSECSAQGTFGRATLRVDA